MKISNNLIGKKKDKKSKKKNFHWCYERSEKM